MADPALARFVERLMLEEIAPLTSPPRGFDVEGYARTVLRRFANPWLRHRTLQIAMDGSQKIPVRWLPVLREARRRGRPCPHLVTALAAWLRFLRGRDEAGRELPLDDPMAARLRAALAPAGDDPGALIQAALGIEEVFGRDLREDAALVDDLAAALDRLARPACAPPCRDARRPILPRQGKTDASLRPLRPSRPPPGGARPGPVPADRVRLRFRAGGICGSDLHYYLHGRSGPFELKEPLTLGHEFVGEVAEVGAAVEGVTVGTRVAVDPSLPCRHCRSCREGRENLCENMRYYGSASVFPHVQGGFREAVDVHPSQCVPLPEGMPYELAVFAEPLAVTLQAVGRAGPVFGRSVLVTGCGPIGALTVATLKAAGAAWITATDLLEGPLAKARAVGADEAIDVANDAPALDRYRARRGRSTSRSRPRAASPGSRPASTASGRAASWSSSATSRAAPGRWSSRR